MRSQFSLFQSHLDLAHRYWKDLIQPDDRLIDATCGNGQDTLFLAKCLNHLTGSLYAIDILGKAIELTRQHLRENLESSFVDRVHFIQGCHSQFPQEIAQKSVKLIVYNLGYLPGGGNKNQTTQVETTLQSLEQALGLIMPGGAISLTLYPGHSEGKREENAILEFTKQLDPFIWNCCHHHWINRSKSPSLLFLQKRIQP